MSKTLKKLLENGKISLAVSYLKGFEKGETEIDRETLVSALKNPDPKVKYHAVKGAYKRLSEESFKELLKEAFGVEVESSPVEFQFPVVNGNGGEIAKGIALLVDKRQGGKVSQIEELTGKGVLALFDREFSGDSFQAPLAYALLYRELPENLLLSGKLSGEEFSADHLKEKEEIARKEGKILIGKGNIRKLGEFLKGEKTEIPLFIGTGEKESLNQPFELLCRTVNFKPVKGYLDEELLIFPLPATLPHSESWLPFFKNFRKRTLEIKDRIPFPFSLHLALKTPITFSFGAGIVIGTGKLPIAVYHFENGKYHRVIDLTEDSRQIKRRRRELRHIEIISETEKETDTAVVALQVASHETRRKGEELAEHFNGDFFYIHAPELKGGVPLSENWTEIVAELYEAMNRVYDRGYRKFHLIMSVPNPIAFALGMAVGNYWDIEVWSYFKELKDYKPVFNAGEIPNI